MSPRPSPIEPLEARIAPALTLRNPLPDLLAGPGKTGAVVDLSQMFDSAATSPNRTIVEFITNFDTNTSVPGLQAGIIRIELFDDLAPLAVQNFLSYVHSKNARGDYDGTFFHRAGSLSGSNIPREVLQGGGFELSAKGQPAHIDTGLPVHNEYRNDTPNTRGTISAAKTGLSPNTATSEFFINLTDNSSALGATNNGGFTVFGRITDESLTIVDAIGNLPTVQVISGFGAPVQNFAGGSSVTADQLIRITDARVIPPTPGNTTGITLTLESVFEAGTTTPSSLVTGTVSGSNLNLKYKAGATGAVDIVVKAVGPDGPLDVITDTFTVTVQPNLITGFVSSTLPEFLTIGQSKAVKLQVSNSGGGIARGTVDVAFYLAEVNTSTGALLDGGARIAVGELVDRSISIAGGGSATLTANLLVPTDLATDTTKVYRLIAEMSGDGSLGTQELFGDDNVALNGNNQGINQFGGSSAKSSTPITYVEADGDRVTFTLTGGGIGQLVPGPGGLDLSVLNTTEASKLSARIVKGPGGDGRIAMNDLNIQSVLHSATLGLVDVNGFVNASGGLRSLQLGDLEGQGSIVIGALLPANTTGATIKLGRVSDYALESSMPISSLTAVEWLDTGGIHESLTFLSLGKLDITGARGVRGDLQAGINVVGSTTVQSIRVAGFLQDAGIATAGDVSSIALGGVDGGGIVIGFLPVTQSGAAIGDGHLGKFVINGIAGFSGNLFIDTRVIAETIGSIVVQKVDSSGGAVHGFVADAISRYNRNGGPKLSNLDDPALLTPSGQADKVGQYEVRIV